MVLLDLEHLDWDSLIFYNPHLGISGLKLIAICLENLTTYTGVVINIIKRLTLNKVSFIAFLLWLQSSLVHKARQVYSALSIDDSAQYKDVKKAILRTYELLPGTYRQKFQNTVKSDVHTHI